MNQHTTARVLTGDDGAPVDTDCVLALATRWGDVPLSLTHLKPGVPLTPLDGVEVRWDHGLPIIATRGAVNAQVQKGGNALVEAGRRVALDQGDVFLATAGALTLEARLVRRSEAVTALPRRDTRTFALVVTHSLMIAAAVLAMMLLTPRVETESMWSSVPGRLIHAVTPTVTLPKVAPPAELQEKIATVMQNAVPAFTTTAKRTANSVLKSFFPGGGGGGVFSGGLNSSISQALDNLSAGSTVGRAWA